MKILENIYPWNQAPPETEVPATGQILESPRKKERCVSTNVYYEDVFPHGSIRMGQLHPNLESYAASISNGPIDGATLSLVSRHYRNAFEVEIVQ